MTSGYIFIDTWINFHNFLQVKLIFYSPTRTLMILGSWKTDFASVFCLAPKRWLFSSVGSNAQLVSGRQGFESRLSP